MCPSTTESSYCTDIVLYNISFLVKKIILPQNKCIKIIASFFKSAQVPWTYFLGSHPDLCFIYNLM